MKILLPYTEKRKTLDLIYEEGVKRGHEITLCNLTRLEFRNGDLYFNGKDLSNQDLVFFRDIRRNVEEKNLISIYFKNKGIPVFDRRLTKTAANSKIGTAIDMLNHNLPYPKTYSNFNILELDKETQKSYFDFLVTNLWSKFIMKPIDGRHGKWVYLVSDFETFISSHQEWILCMYQEFIENDGDLRIIVIGGECIGAILRKWKDGSFINNVAMWGDFYQVDISDSVKDIAINTANVLEIDVAGVDIIIDKNTGLPYILEVNRSPEFEWFIQATGMNIPGKIFDFLEKQI